MNWDRIDSTVRNSIRKNGHEIADVSRARTPLSELMAKDSLPDLEGMTELQLCEFAAESNTAIPEDLSREQMIEVIKAAAEKNWDERLRGMRGTLDYIFADGTHPLQVVRRLYSIAKAVRPECVLNMSLADLAVLCDDGKGRFGTDGRGTMSARVKRLFEAPVKKAGMRGFKAAYQKDVSAGAAYSSSAQGNKNRHGREFLELNGEHKRKAA